MLPSPPLRCSAPLLPSEETSLVARPAISFDDCQRRMEARLRHLGITVRAIEEQE